MVFQICASHYRSNLKLLVPGAMIIDTDQSLKLDEMGVSLKGPFGHPGFGSNSVCHRSEKGISSSSMSC